MPGVFKLYMRYVVDVPDQGNEADEGKAPERVSLADGSNGQHFDGRDY